MLHGFGLPIDWQFTAEAQSAQRDDLVKQSIFAGSLIQLRLVDSI